MGTEGAGTKPESQRPRLGSSPSEGTSITFAQQGGSDPGPKDRVEGRHDRDRAQRIDDHQHDQQLSHLCLKAKCRKRPEGDPTDDRRRGERHRHARGPDRPANRLIEFGRGDGFLSNAVHDVEMARIPNSVFAHPSGRILWIRLQRRLTRFSGQPPRSRSGLEKAAGKRLERPFHARDPQLFDPRSPPRSHLDLRPS